MPTPTKGARLGSAPSHERKILANLAASLFEHRSITTTLTKAKRLRPYAERLITHAKQGDLAARRRVVAKISGHNATNQAIVHELFTVIAPAMAQRPGGYTRITKIGNRKGDNAPMAVIELVMEPYSPKQQVVQEATSAAASAAPAVTEEAEEVSADTVQNDDAVTETQTTEGSEAAEQAPDDSAEENTAQEQK